jgi:hypothetical protein
MVLRKGPLRARSHFAEKGGQGGEEALPLLYFSATQKHKMKRVFRAL